MNKQFSQKGVGLIEVLVALLILAVGILGFVALQYRAVEATSEAINRVQAMNIARDLAERIRVNRNALATYKTQTANANTLTAVTVNCIGSASANRCTDAQLANFDVKQVKQKAETLGMTMNMMNCQSTNNRSCIYVAWGDTSATNGTGTGNCTNDTAYLSTSTCVIMETY